MPLCLRFLRVCAVDSRASAPHYSLCLPDHRSFNVGGCFNVCGSLGIGSSVFACGENHPSRRHNIHVFKFVEGGFLLT